MIPYEEVLSSYVSDFALCIEERDGAAGKNSATAGAGRTALENTASVNPLLE